MYRKHAQKNRGCSITGAESVICRNTGRLLAHGYVVYHRANVKGTTKNPYRRHWNGDTVKATILLSRKTQYVAGITEIHADGEAQALQSLMTLFVEQVNNFASNITNIIKR